MDISEFGINDEFAEDVLQPGIYNMSYVKAEEIEGKNNYLGVKMYFQIDGTSHMVAGLFGVRSNDQKVVDRGKQSLAMLCNAAGLTELKNTDDLKGKVVSCKVKHNEKGYPEIDDSFGRNWKKVEVQEKPQKKKSTVSESDDDEIPF
jgi:hypothetical protein